MSDRPPLPYSSREEVLPYIIKHRFQMSLSEITNICAWALDRNSVERAAILNFVRSLGHIDPASLGPDPSDQDCSICLNKYDIVPESDTPAKLPCGHIMGAECIQKWLRFCETCPYCRSRVFRRPDEPEEFTDERNLLRDILIAGTDFLTETFWDADESYIAFYHWASGAEYNDQSAASRSLAMDCMTKLEMLAEIPP